MKGKSSRKTVKDFASYYPNGKVYNKLKGKPFEKLRAHKDDGTGCVTYYIGATDLFAKMLTCEKKYDNSYKKSVDKFLKKLKAK
ncbi:MAG: hypothetical protein OCD01_04140 [Fibrobacterales bacterium]